MEKKKHLFDIQMNSIVDTDNPTKKEVEFILHGFDVSHNYAFISKETTLKSLHSLRGMPIVARYHEKSENEADDDALGSHEVQFERDRKTGEPLVTMGTVPIGVFTEDAYISTIKDADGNEKEVVVGKGILWASRFPNVIGLLKEWMNHGVNVVSSMEILYDSYKVVDGITEILNFVYEGHAILNSEERGSHKKVYPAYDESKLTKLVAEAMNQNNEDKEVIKMEEKIVNQEEVLENAQEILPTTPEKVEEQIIEEDSEKVEEEVPQESSEADKLQNEILELREKCSEMESKHNTLLEQFNEAAEKITQLNSTIEELTPYKEKVETENFEKALSEKKEVYKAKFEAVKAVSEFESEEVQNLIKLSLNEGDQGKEAIYQLNSKLVDLVVSPKKEDSTIRETASKRENLIPSSDSFESRYSL